MKLFDIFKRKEKETNVFYKECCSDPLLIEVKSTFKSREEIIKEVEEEYNIELSRCLIDTYGVCNYVCINCGECRDCIKEMKEKVEAVAKSIIKSNAELALAEKIWSENCISKKTEPIITPSPPDKKYYYKFITPSPSDKKYYHE